MSTKQFEEYFGGIGPRSTPIWDENLRGPIEPAGTSTAPANTGEIVWKNPDRNQVEGPNGGVSASL